MHDLNDAHIAEAILALEPNALFSVTGIEESDVNWLNEDDITKPAWEDILAKAQESVDAYNAKEYARNRAVQYPSLEEFMEAYTEKEILDDSTKWDEYVVKYNKVKSDNPKPTEEEASP